MSSAHSRRKNQRALLLLREYSDLHCTEQEQTLVQDSKIKNRANQLFLSQREQTKSTALARHLAGNHRTKTHPVTQHRSSKTEHRFF